MKRYKPCCYCGTGNMKTHCGVELPGERYTYSYDYCHDCGEVLQVNDWNNYIYLMTLNFLFCMAAYKPINRRV